MAVTHPRFVALTDPELYIVRGDAYLGVYDIASAIQNYRRADKLLLAGDTRIPGSALSNTGLRLSELHAIYARRYCDPPSILGPSAL